MSRKPIPLPVIFEEPDDHECPKCPPPGSPAWMATFADIATLLMAFFDHTGCPVLVNTSFNVRGEPIVNTPENTLDTFTRSGLDTLVMGNFVLDK